MTEREVAILLGIMQNAYPKFYANGFDVEIAVSLWYEMLQDIGIDLAKAAVHMHISTSPFPPTISDIRKHALNAVNKSVSADEAWGQVKKAISTCGIYQEEKALKSMDESVAKLVRRFGFKDLCMSENIMADRAHFIKLWEASSKYEKEQALIPKNVKDKLLLLTKNIGDLNLKQNIELKERL